MAPALIGVQAPKVIRSLRSYRNRELPCTMIDSSDRGPSSLHRYGVMGCNVSGMGKRNIAYGLRAPKLGN